MPFPKQADIEVPLLKVLVDLGGASEPRKLYSLVAAHFPDLSAEEQEERLESSPSTRKWSNLVQWARQNLVEQGQIDRSQRGVWKVTETGRARAAGSAVPHVPRVRSEPAPRVRTEPPAATVSQSAAPTAGLRDLVNANSQEVKARLIAELQDLTPRAFEHFCKELLSHLGFRNVEVTKRSQDGGIDGFGDFRQGAIAIRSAFQAKRWTENPVGRPDIDRLRGAIQGEFDHGVFLTTSRFSKEAKEASYRKGAISILLLDGPAIADLLLERGLGVRKIPLYLLDVDEDFFDIAED